MASLPFTNQLAETQRRSKGSIPAPARKDLLSLHEKSNQRPIYSRYMESNWALDCPYGNILFQEFEAQNRSHTKMYIISRDIVLSCGIILPALQQTTDMNASCPRYRTAFATPKPNPNPTLKSEARSKTQKP